MAVKVVGEATRQVHEALDLGRELRMKLVHWNLFGTCPEAMLIEEPAVFVQQATDSATGKNRAARAKHQVQAHAELGAVQRILQLRLDIWLVDHHGRAGHDAVPVDVKDAT
jgi:hypothetical protein